MAADAALRLDAFERVRDALDALAELGAASQILDHAAAAAAAAADLDRVVLSRIVDGTLVVERVHPRAAHDNGCGERLGSVALRLSYPLLECELLRRRQARLVDDIDHTQPARYAFLDLLRWSAYVATPVIVDTAVVGFLHGDRATGRRPLTQLDAVALERFAAGFALLFERAVLRRRLRDQRREIRRISTWAEARAGELSDGVIDLSGAGAEEQDQRTSSPEPTEDDAATHLTPRELDVLRLMADGKTNGDIARALFVSEGTVKFHVKNILRKMQASNRSDAGARYLRSTMHEGPPAHTPTLR